VNRMIVSAALVAALAQPAPPKVIAPGAPGAKATWTNGNKQGVGTALAPISKVWFTLGDGVLTEAYYPTVDKANLRMLEFIVTDGAGFFERESVDADHRVDVLGRDVLAFRQTNTSRSGRYQIVRETFTDPARQTIVIRVHFQPNRPSLKLYVYVDPAIDNSGLHDTADASGDMLIAAQGNVFMATSSSTGFGEKTCGFVGVNDGLADLRSKGRIARRFDRAVDGNVAELAEIRPPTSGAFDFQLAVSFGSSADGAVSEARSTLSQPIERTFQAYTDGWRQYVATLEPVEAAYADEYAMSAMVLRAHEDKTFRGAIIASMTIPWGDGVDAGEGNAGGYHLVWARDLYEVATAFIALGDRAAAERALDYLFRVQQKPDGSFPQNSWLDGRPYWGSLQLDEVAYPIVLAQQLGRTDAQTYRDHVRPAAEFIVSNGPATPQERWEEETGYSPSTIAAEIAGLVCAAAIADEQGDGEAAARYRSTADAWLAKFDAWTTTRTGPLAAQPYYIRVAQHGMPDSGEPLEINNGGGTYDERSIVDAGFLELVRLGIRPPTYPLIPTSLAIVDQTIKVETPNGPGWYRYNHDGYGEKADGRGWDETGVGRLWPLLTGERGEYELARGGNARPLLETLQKFANAGRMLPEQVWDRPDSPARSHLRFGEGTGSATPLAWTHAQFIRLALGVKHGRVIETPEVVRRYFADHREKGRGGNAETNDRPRARSGPGPD
jgi:glucan 1,4-alpha-glucosidase